MLRLSIRCRFGSLLLAVWLAIALAGATSVDGQVIAMPETPHKNYLPLISAQPREARAL
jgi:hypothetical protein